jgi:hypothetical protein
MTLWKRREEVGYHHPAVSVNITTTRTSFRWRKLNLLFFFSGRRGRSGVRPLSSGVCASQRVLCVVPRAGHCVQYTQSDGRHSETGLEPAISPSRHRRTHPAESRHTAKFKCSVPQRFLLVTVFSVQCMVQINDVQFSGSQFRRVFFAQLLLSLISV